MRILWNSLLVMLVPFWMWYQGTYEKYPELAMPLFFIWLAVLAPSLNIPDWHWKWKRLERFREKRGSSLLLTLSSAPAICSSHGSTLAHRIPRRLLPRHEPGTGSQQHLPR